MKNVNKSLPFEAIHDDEYDRYLMMAEMLHERGLLLEKSVLQLAKILYEKDIDHEN